MEILFEGNTEERYAASKHILDGAKKRARDLRKMAVDPMDVLRCLIDEEEIQQKLIAHGIDKNIVIDEIGNVDEGTPQGFRALAFLNKTNMLPGIESTTLWSPTLVLTLNEAESLADSHNSFDISPQYIFWGLLAVPDNTALDIFSKKLRLPLKKLKALAQVVPSMNSEL